MTPILETERLLLRQLTREDFPALHAILSDPETMRYYPKPFDEDKTRQWIEWNLDNYQRYGFGLWAVILKETDTFLGDCGITMQNIHGQSLPEIGFHLDKRFWRRGYATEAAKACLDYAFTHTDFDELFCYQKYTNLPSRGVAEKMGMTLREEYADPVNTVTSVYAVKRKK